MQRHKRILVYGFGPYGQFRENITAAIVKSLPPAAGLKRVVFPVRFQRGQFLDALKRHKPEIVLGLGQSSRRTIELETRAANCRRSEKSRKGRAIDPQGPRWLATTLKFRPNLSLRRSTDAGDYVCNYSMYVMLRQIQRAQAEIPLGFLHIPFNYPTSRARRMVASVLRNSAARKPPSVKRRV